MKLASVVQEQVGQRPTLSAPPSTQDGSAHSAEQEEVPAGIIESEPVADQLDLPSAVALSYRLQPRLRVYMESIAQARANS
ncbi:MAG TPA: hypothetical protein VHX39_10625, partial [Acetobacteraceae bacterium]|nr:hypothetical protein [Acetobacteraceae bacterium]